MTPKQLQAWQPQASIAQLQAFSKENATLLQLLEETWQKFNRSYHTHAAVSPDEAEDYPFIQQLAEVLPKKDIAPAEAIKSQAEHAPSEATTASTEPTAPSVDFPTIEATPTTTSETTTCAQSAESQAEHAPSEATTAPTEPTAPSVDFPAIKATPTTTSETICAQSAESQAKHTSNETETTPIAATPPTLTLQKTEPLPTISHKTIDTQLAATPNENKTPLVPPQANYEPTESNSLPLQQEKIDEQESSLQPPLTQEEIHSLPFPADTLPSEIYLAPDSPASDLAESTNMPIFPHTPQPTPITPTTPTIPQLPNARLEEPYAVALNEDLAQRIKNIQFFPECGLSWQAEQRSIIGTPTLHGEIEVQFSLHDRGNLTLARQTLYINPNPQSLWQNIPSNPATAFYKPDEACETHPTPEGNLLAARVRGRSHAHVGSCCDDDFALQYHVTTRAHLLAVSDGAGSAAFSRLGSQLAVQAAINTLYNLLNDPDKPFHKLANIVEAETLEHIVHNLFAQAVYDAYKAQHEAVQQHDIIPDVKSLSCTLLLALSLPLSNEQWLSAAYWVGDGAVALWQPEQQALCLLGSTDSGAYSGETRFLNKEEANAEKIQQRTSIKLSHLPPVLILMTDGVSDPKFETDANLAKTEYWRNLWQELQVPLDEADPALALQKWLNFWSAGNHDDRTLALFIPKIAEHTPHTETENT